LSLVVFSADDVWVKAWESLQPGAESRELTDDWAFIQSASIEVQGSIRTIPQIGYTENRHEVVAEDATLQLGALDDGSSFDLASNRAIKYKFVVEAYDEDEQETVTYACYDCTPVKSGLTTGDLNDVSRKWKVGRVVKS